MHRMASLKLVGADAIKGIFRDPLIPRTLFSTHTNFIAYSERTLLIILTLYRTSEHNSFHKNQVDLCISDAKTSEMEIIHVIPHTYLANIKSYPTGILNISFFKVNFVLICQK